MSTLCSEWNIFFHFFPHETIYFRIYSLFIFSLIFFFYYLFITSILGKSKSCNIFCFFIITRVVTMCESALKILSIFNYFSDITYETLHRRGFVWNERKHFYLIQCWFIFFHLIDKGFYPICEFVFRWCTHLGHPPLYVTFSVCPSVCRTPYLRNRTSSDHSFW